MTKDATLAHWEENGFLILPGFFSPTQIDALSDAEARIWRERHPDVVVDDLMTGERKRLCHVGEDDRRDHIFKLNDLYLCDSAVRDIALHPELTTILARLLNDCPVLCNSLSFARGSQQAEHVDSIYMTPLNVGNLAATWITQEDCHPDAGPLFYYPGSHRLPLYRFDDGSYHFSPLEQQDWHKYLAQQISKHGLKSESFCARRGDVFIWHANLVHGGSAIRNLERTRRSLVSHYYTARDCRTAGVDCEPLNGGYWLRKAHPAVPGEELQEAPPLPAELVA